MIIIQWIATLFGIILRFIYNLVGQNYGLSIIIFTIVTKILLFPITYKQTKAMEAVKKISPLEKEIREKHKGNKEKISEELTNMYKEQKVNPFASCLPLLIQLPIIIAMFYIVKQPLTYIKQMPVSEVKVYAQQILKKETVTDTESKNMEIQIAKENNLINMRFAGINFGETPKDIFNKNIEVAKRPSKLILAIPVISALLSIIQIKISQKNSVMTKEQIEQQKTMNLMMPLLSGWISYAMPVALGVYWVFGSLLQIISQIIINELIQKNTKTLLNKGGE